MKQKDIVLLIVTVLILSVAGYLAFTQLVPGNSSTTSKVQGTEVDSIGVIRADLDSVTVAKLQDSTQTRDFSVTIDLSTGLGNSAPFGR